MSNITSKPIDSRAAIQKIKVRETLNPRWSSYFKNQLLTVPEKPLFGPQDTVFTIGSCFAERIRIALSEQEIRVGPPTHKIPIKEDRYRIDSLPTRPHMNYYNSFTIRQEFERHIGAWEQAPDDYWTLPRDQIWSAGEPIYQDPYRRAIFGRSPEDLREAVEHCDVAIDSGLRAATVFFITLGMTEVFRNKASGAIACQKPGYARGAGEDETEFHLSTYEENLNNMLRVVEIINRINPLARIVVTVSPVALARTFTDQDILSANTESKSVLRAVLGELSRCCENVTYFPSYEIVMTNAPFSFREDDGRHVADWVVSQIVSTFLSAHYDPSYELSAVS